MRTQYKCPYRTSFQQFENGSTAQEGRGEKRRDVAVGKKMNRLRSSGSEEGALQYQRFLLLLCFRLPKVN